MYSKYCGTVLIKQGTNDEEIEKPMQISWDNVPLNSNKVGHLEFVYVKRRKKTALAEHGVIVGTYNKEITCQVN